MSTDDDQGEARHLWTEIRRISETLVSINTKLDGIVPELQDHEQRLRKLEERRFPLASVSALVAVLSLVVALVGVYFSR